MMKTPPQVYNRIGSDQLVIGRWKDKRNNVRSPRFPNGKVVGMIWNSVHTRQYLLSEFTCLTP